MTKYLYEVFEDIAKSANQEEAINKVKLYNDELRQRNPADAMAFRTVFKGTVDTDLIWVLPKSDPPFQPADEHNAPRNLYREIGKMAGYFLEGNRNCIQNRTKREGLYLQFLESLHPEDAKLVIDMIKGDSRHKHITVSVARGAFGDTFLEEDRRAAVKKVQEHRQEADRLEQAIAKATS